MNVTAIILAGGKSSRFKKDKTVLRLDGEMIVERIVRECRTAFNEIMIVSNRCDKFPFPGVRELEDIYKDTGPLGGIHAGLTHMSNETAFVTACDMPFFDVAAASHLVKLCGIHDVMVPRDGEKLQPLFAVYRRTALPQIEALLKSDDYSMRALFGKVNTGYLDRKNWCGNFTDSSKLFYNINHPADYEKLLNCDADGMEPSP